MGFLKSIRCPVFNAERIKEVPERADYTIQIGGECEKTGIFKLDDFLINFKIHTVSSRLTSVSKWSVRADWQGILWQDFLDWVKPSAEYKFLYTESWGGYKTSLAAELLHNPRVLICTGVAGEEIEHEYGGPLRMVIPNQWGFKSCKWLKKIYFTDEYVRGFWEANGYGDDGTILPCMVEDVNTGKHVRIKGGEITEF